MSEKKVIEAAYEDQIKGMFGVLCDNAIVDGLDVAIERFKKGLKLMRTVRDTALSVVESKE
jgi:hypothetical protein